MKSQNLSKKETLLLAALQTFSNNASVSQSLLYKMSILTTQVHNGIMNRSACHCRIPFNSLPWWRGLEVTLKEKKKCELLKIWNCRDAEWIHQYIKTSRWRGPYNFTNLLLTTLNMLAKCISGDIHSFIVLREMHCFLLHAGVAHTFKATPIA